MSSAIQVSAPSVGSDGVVSASVDRRRIWFGSRDVALRASAEAFAGPMWLPALSSGANLEVAAPVDWLWRENLKRVARVAESWWGCDPRRAVSPAGTRNAAPPTPGTMLSFTAGVDSFYTLISSPRPPDALVFAAGFDVPLTDRARLRAVEASLREVADRIGARAIVIRTNLRGHARVSRLPWGIAHGGAIAALGHLLADEHGSLLISSTHARDDLRPWGTDWRLDPLWSASDLVVRHRGADVPRERKVLELASIPLVQEHLRVCFVRGSGRLNCGRCDKCLAAMVTLHAAGCLERFATFDGEDDLAERLEDLKATEYQAMYPRILADGVPEPVAGAVGRLLERSVAGSGHAVLR